MSPEVKEFNQEVFQEFFSFVGDIYVALGFVKVKDPPKLTIQEMTAEEFSKKVNDFGSRVGTVCFRHGIEAPLAIEAMSLAGSAFNIFGLPILGKFFPSKEEPKPAESKPESTRK